MQIGGKGQARIAGRWPFLPRIPPRWVWPKPCNGMAFPCLRLRSAWRSFPTQSRSSDGASAERKNGLFRSDRPVRWAATHCGRVAYDRSRRSVGEISQLSCCVFSEQIAGPIWQANDRRSGINHKPQNLRKYGNLLRFAFLDLSAAVAVAIHPLVGREIDLRRNRLENLSHLKSKSSRVAEFRSSWRNRLLI